jgi:tetratricopeptide (TPR) repeat protein
MNYTSDISVKGAGPMSNAPQSDARGRGCRRGIWVVHGILFLLSAGLATSGGLMLAASHERPSELAIPHPQTQMTAEAPDTSAAEASEEVVAAVRAFFTRFGEWAEGDGENRTPELFDFERLRVFVPPELIGGGLKNADQAATAAVSSRHRDWKSWEWEHPEVRRVTVSAQGTITRAVVWHRTGYGEREKVRWLLVKGTDGWRVADWEDLVRGVCGSDLVALQAAILNDSHRYRRLGRFSDLCKLELDHVVRFGPYGAHKEDEYQGARALPQLRYAIELLDARLGVRRPMPGVVDLEDAADIAEELNQTRPDRLAALPALAEAALALNDPHRAIKACNAYIAAAGDDADVLAVRAAARAKLQVDEGGEFTLALQIDPYQPQALDWKRKRGSKADKLAVASAVATAPVPRRVFDHLAASAERDDDWVSLLDLGEQYRNVRPQDDRWAEALIVALIHTDRVTDAATVLREAGAHFPEVRRRLLERLVSAMIDTGRVERVYTAIPDGYRSAAFRLLVRHFEFERNPPAPLPDRPNDASTLAQRSLDTLLATHRRRHPDDVWLAVYDGRALNDREEWAKAAEVLTTAFTHLDDSSAAEWELEGAYGELVQQMLPAYYHTGRGVEIFRRLKRGREVFKHLAEWYARDEDAAGLQKLIDERESFGEADESDPYWRGVAHRLSGKFAEATAEYRRYLVAPSGLNWFPSQYDAHDQLVRCLVRAGEFNQARLELTGKRGHSPPLEIKALVMAKGGKPGEAEALLRKELEEWFMKVHGTSRLYSDPDLGPILKADPAFAAFRKDFPPPDDKPTPPR